MPEQTGSGPMTPEELLEEEIEDLERPMLHSWLPWVISFGALILFAGLLALLFLLPPSTHRGPLGASGLPLLTLAEPQGRIQDVPERFRWIPVAGATAYIVTVTNEIVDEAVILRPVTEVTLTPTDSERSLLKPGLYSWMVEARGRDGTPLAQGEGAFELPESG